MLLSQSLVSILSLSSFGLVSAGPYGQQYGRDANAELDRRDLYPESEKRRGQEAFILTYSPYPGGKDAPELVFPGGGSRNIPCFSSLVEISF